MEGQIERGYFKKRWTGRLPIALVFPNEYSIGMSNLGFLFLYERLNSYDSIVCERVFYQEKKPIVSVESKRPLKDFPILLFAIPFEGDYLRTIKTLTQSGIPLWPEERSQIIFAGGVAVTANPLPIAPFFDGFFLGEWETMEGEVVPLFLEFFQEKEKLIERLGPLPFFYFPTQEKKRVKVAKTKSGFNPVFSTTLSANAEFKDSYLLEVSRGCGQNCRFCLVGYLFRPPRAPNSEEVKLFCERLSEKAKLGLIGLEFANPDLLQELWPRLRQKNLILTFSSLRAERITEEFLRLLSTTRSIALAPETASYRLKKILNKMIPQELIFKLLAKFKQTNLKKIKFYFMYGLPTETYEDLKETVSFIKLLLKGKYPFIFRFTFSPFVPKPHTPFQWIKLEELKVLKERETYLKRELRGIDNLSFEPLKMARLQALMARGDKTTGHVLYKNLNKSPSQLLKALEGINESFPNDPAHPLPWDFIETGVQKSYLFSEWKKAKIGILSKPCEVGSCRVCSACSYLNHFRDKKSSLDEGKIPQVSL